ncbi:MAG: UDP-2,3-diacylglucosamine diphosphatase [Bacteroidia bacterium]|nr:UDP-2,3-diacylglucosamine diphosphatase [Bacteroidia bacterium]
MSSKKIYFASDFHLGVPSKESSLKREKTVCRWLDSIKHDAAAIYLVGDIFDFWYEYKYTVPKGTVRLLGKIAELTDAGIPVHFFIGNHDLWMKDYFTDELNVTVHHQTLQTTFGGKKFYISHGDGLGPGDNWYKLLRTIFASKTCQWLFSRLHPNLAFYIAKRSSKRRKVITGDSDEKFLGNENEWLFLYSREVLKTTQVDYFIFGHRHLPLDLDVDGKARYINLGEWINYNTYAVFDGENLELKKFEA